VSPGPHGCCAYAPCTCLRKQDVGKPNQNAAQLYARAQVCVNNDLSDDGLWKGWGFRVGTGSAGEVGEALTDTKIDVACNQDGEVVDLASCLRSEVRRNPAV